MVDGGGSRVTSTVWNSSTGAIHWYCASLPGVRVNGMIITSLLACTSAWARCQGRKSNSSAMPALLQASATTSSTTPAGLPPAFVVSGGNSAATTLIDAPAALDDG